MKYSTHKYRNSNLPVILVNRNLIDFIAKKKTTVVGNAQRQTAQKVVPISVS
jgi:hypothetical protein